MICRRRLISAIISVMLLTGFVHADMVPVFNMGVERQEALFVCDQSEIQPTTLSGLYDNPILGDFDVRAIQLQPEIGVDIGQSAKVPHAIELSGGPSSIHLCLYALMSLGLCSAPHWIKRLSLGHLPEWYHDNGPFQIGHSYAATPESLYTLQTCYLDPPINTAKDSLQRYRQRTVVPRWRKSQFDLGVIASRGPPNMS